MKKLITVLILSLISGCTVIDAYLMKYDPNEYQSISEIRTFAYFSKDDCNNVSQSKINADILSKKITALKNLSEFIPHNDKVISSTVELEKMAIGFKDQYIKSDKVSSAFCKIKLKSIEESAESMQKIIGAKPR